MTEVSGDMPEPRRWEDDVLGREGLADFLTRSLVEQSKILRSTQRPGLTVALDADWGTGKTFFVKHWTRDLQASGYPVVFFDAWENDIGDEAAIALMASINAELKNWTQKLSTKKQVQRLAKETTLSAIKGLRRALVPASKIVATGLIKKVTGIAVEEVFDALTESSNDLTTDVSDAASETLESGLDELFKKALDEHQLRALAIVNFKSSISQLIRILETEAQAKLPIFVFVDEVDRCRPTYAIKLLEEIKHIFGINEICFVVSTNLNQLQESVRAIYGAGFDGHRYLKRFFDHQYTFHDPDNESFAQQLLQHESALSIRKIATGLPGKPNTARAIATISTAFGLDLRSQKQVFSMADSVAAAIPQEKKIHVLWLFFLCALQHRKPLSIEALHARVDQKQFYEICQDVLRRDLEIEYSQPRDPYDRSNSIKKAKLSETLLAYYQWSLEDLLKLRDKNINIYDYPQSNLHQLIEEAPHSYIPSESYPPSIAKYIEWVRFAGMATP